MTFAPINSQSSYLPVEFALPKDGKDFIDFINKRERLTASIVNIKENGNYENNEILSGQQWFATSFTPRKNRYTYRTVVDFGPLPNASTGTKPHNISVTQTTIFTKILATATNPSTKFIPLPYVNVTTPTDGVEIWVDATNVNIKTTTANYIAFTTCYVVLEYLKS